MSDADSIPHAALARPGMESHDDAIRPASEKLTKRSKFFSRKVRRQIATTEKGHGPQKDETTSVARRIKEGKEPAIKLELSKGEAAKVHAKKAQLATSAHKAEMRGKEKGRPKKKSSTTKAFERVTKDIELVDKETKKAKARDKNLFTAFAETMSFESPSKIRKIINKRKLRSAGTSANKSALKFNKTVERLEQSTGVLLAKLEQNRLQETKGKRESEPQQEGDIVANQETGSEHSI